MTQPPPLPSKSSDWFGRNAKWFIPLLALLGVGMLCAFVGGIYFLVTSMMRSSEPYQQAVAIAQQDPRVAAAMGAPLKEGWFITGNINISNSSGRANLNIPLSGSISDGSLRLAASKSEGVWTFSHLSLRVKKSGEEILLTPAPIPAGADY